MNNEAMKANVSDRSKGAVELVGQYVNINTKCDVRCTACHYEWSVILSGILYQGTGCPKCSAKKISESNRKGNAIIAEKDGCVLIDISTCGNPNRTCSLDRVDFDALGSRKVLASTAGATPLVHIDGRLRSLRKHLGITGLNNKDVSDLRRCNCAEKIRANIPASWEPIPRLEDVKEDPARKLSMDGSLQIGAIFQSAPPALPYFNIWKHGAAVNAIRNADLMTLNIRRDGLLKELADSQQ
jgi:hypothetical protein